MLASRKEDKDFFSFPKKGSFWRWETKHLLDWPNKLTSFV